MDSNLVCLFKNRWSQCPRYCIGNTCYILSLPIIREIIKIKKKMEHKLEKYNMSYSKYSNWPSCDSSDWMTRYWGEIYSMVQCTFFPNSGENYPRLLAIKATWDPGNVFNHCQSVGSTDNSCCPFTLNRPQGPPPP